MSAAYVSAQHRCVQVFLEVQFPNVCRSCVLVLFRHKSHLVSVQKRSCFGLNSWFSLHKHSWKTPRHSVKNIKQFYTHSYDPVLSSLLKVHEQTTTRSSHDSQGVNTKLLLLQCQICCLFNWQYFCWSSHIYIYFDSVSNSKPWRVPQEVNHCTAVFRSLIFDRLWSITLSVRLQACWTHVLVLIVVLLQTTRVVSYFASCC